MSEAYGREEQNNALLASLGSKVTALRDVTNNIYDQARDHEAIYDTTNTFENMGQSIKGSMGRLTRMAGQGNKVAVLKLSGMIIAVVVVLWWLMKLIFGGSGKA